MSRNQKMSPTELGALYPEGTPLVLATGEYGTVIRVQGNFLEVHVPEYNSPQLVYPVTVRRATLADVPPAAAPPTIDVTRPLADLVREAILAAALYAFNCGAGFDDDEILALPEVAAALTKAEAA